MGGKAWTRGSVSHLLSTSDECCIISQAHLHHERHKSLLFRRSAVAATDVRFDPVERQGGTSVPNYVVPHRRNKNVIISGASLGAAGLNDEISEAPLVITYEVKAPMIFQARTGINIQLARG